MAQASIRVRPMMQEDVPAVAEIERQNFSDPWTEKGFSDTLCLEDTLYLVAESETEIIGYVGLYRSFDEADIVNVSVKPAWQGRGVGRRMLDVLMEQGGNIGITAFTLEVRVSNDAAIRLYTSLGFEIVGTRRNFYAQPTEDAYILWKR